MTAVNITSYICVTEVLEMIFCNIVSIKTFLRFFYSENSKSLF